MTDTGCSETSIHQARVQAVLPPVLDETAAMRLAEVFKALSDPSRVRIVALEMSQSAVSHQLRTLRDLRLVRWRREGRQIFYTLDDEHVADLFRMGLDHVSHG
jgi:DNA-binding transcriptional ArsR family regulator